MINTMKTIKNFGFIACITIAACIAPYVAQAAITINPNFALQLTNNGVNLRLNSIGTVVDASITQITFQADYTPTSGQTGNPTPGTTSSYTFVNNGATTLPLTVALAAPGLKPCTEYAIVLKGVATYQQGTAVNTQQYAIPLPTKGTTPGCPTTNTSTTQNPTNTSTTQNDTTTNFSKLENPLPSINSIPEFIKRLVDIALTIGVPIVALAIIYSGFLLVTARGDKAKLEKGKRAFLAAVIGGAILLGAWVIAQAIGATINQIRK